MTEEEYKSCNNCNNWKDSIYCRKPWKECKDYDLWEPIDEEEKARDEFRELNSTYRVVAPKMTENTKDETIEQLIKISLQKSDLIESMEKEIAQLKENLKSKHFEWDGLDE